MFTMHVDKVLTTVFRMLIWAVDLDDLSGTSINALADAMGKPRSKVLDIDGLDFGLTSDLGDIDTSQAVTSRRRGVTPPGRYMRRS